MKKTIDTDKVFTKDAYHKKTGIGRATINTYLKAGKLTALEVVGTTLIDATGQEVKRRFISAPKFLSDPARDQYVIYSCIDDYEVMKGSELVLRVTKDYLNRLCRKRYGKDLRDMYVVKLKGGE
jgi:hypothetical protein